MADIRKGQERDELHRDMHPKSWTILVKQLLRNEFGIAPEDDRYILRDTAFLYRCGKAYPLHTHYLLPTKKETLVS